MQEAETPGESKRVRIGFVGDLIFGRKVNQAVVGGLTPVEMWGDLGPMMTAADAMVGNLEGPITTHMKRWNKPKAFYFRADPKALDMLTAANFRCVALANNHMLDYGSQGLFDTRDHLTAAGIAFSGAGVDPDEATGPATFMAGGVKVGFLSITNTVPAFAAKPGRPGTNYWKIRTDPKVMGRLGRIIYDLRTAGAELIVLSVHWGPNYRWWPPRRYQAFARQAIDLGVDIVHGHSAHLLQPIEFHRRGVILYDTGDYIDDFIVAPGLRSDFSGLFLVEAGAGLVPRVRIVPTKLTVARVNRATGADAAAIRSYMIRHSRRFGVDFREEDGDLVAEPREAAIRNMAGAAA